MDTLYMRPNLLYNFLFNIVIYSSILPYFSFTKLTGYKIENLELSDIIEIKITIIK